jgi:hypothetical protein
LCRFSYQPISRAKNKNRKSPISPKTDSLIKMPQLNLALEGFSPQQTAQIESWLLVYDQTAEPIEIRWQLSGVYCADVLFKALASPAARGATAVLTKVFWPSVQAATQESSEAARQRFLQMLLDLNNPMLDAAVRYVMGSLIVNRHNDGVAMKGLWHVLATDTLLAVVDFDRVTVSIRPDTHYLELENAHWAARPEHARAPVHFHHISVERLMWEYACRSGQDLLPVRYREREITLRRFPRLPLACLNETELTLLTTLRQKPRSLSQLSQYLQLPTDQTSNILGALYFSGAITTRKFSTWERLGQSISASSRLLFGITQTQPPSHNQQISAPSSLVLGQTTRASR